MSFISQITGVWSWFKKTFISHAQSADTVAVTVTETIKTLLANPVTGLLTNIFDAVTGTNIASNVVGLINAGIIKALTIELGLEGLPPNPTPQQIQAFEDQIMAVFDVKANNSKLYTVLAADVYGIVQTNIDSGKTNFADWVDAVEKAYADYQKDLAANAVVVTQGYAAA